MEESVNRESLAELASFHQLISQIYNWTVTTGMLSDFSSISSRHAFPLLVSSSSSEEALELPELFGKDLALPLNRVAI